MNIIIASFGADITANVSLFSKDSTLLNLTLKTTVEGDFAEQNTKYIYIHEYYQSEFWR